MNPIPENRLTLILGGARSGKTSYVQEQAEQAGGSVLYVATAEANDDEMRERIEMHRTGRPAEWRTLEAPLRVGECLLSNQVREQTVIIDCATMLVSNVILACEENEPFAEVKQKVEAEIEALLEAHSKIGGQWFIVSNEVGLGLVPPYALGRVYRDLLGWANQSLARSAQRVIFMVAGIPTVIK